jgi:hypothetical protein
MDEYNRQLKIYNDKLIANKKRYIENVSIDSIEVSMTSMSPVVDNQDIGAEQRKTLVDQFLRGKFNELTNSNYEVVEFIMNNITDDQDREFLYSFWNKFEIKVVDMLPKQVSKDMFVKLTKAFLLRETNTGSTTASAPTTGTASAVPTTGSTTASGPVVGPSTSGLPPTLTNAQIQNAKGITATSIKQIVDKLNEIFIDYETDVTQLQPSYIDVVKTNFPDLLNNIENTEDKVQNETIDKTPEMAQFKVEATAIKNGFNKAITSIATNMRNANKIQTSANLEAIINHYGFVGISASLNLSPKIDAIINRLKNVSNLTILQNFEKITKHCDKNVAKDKIPDYITNKSDVFSLSNPLNDPSKPTTLLSVDEIANFKTEIQTDFDPTNPSYKRSVEYQVQKKDFDDFRNGPFQIQIYDKLIKYYETEINKSQNSISKSARSIEKELTQIGDLNLKDNNELSAILQNNINGDIVGFATDLAKEYIILDYVTNARSDTIDQRGNLQNSLTLLNTSSLNASGTPASSVTSSILGPIISSTTAPTTPNPNPNTGNGLKMSKRAKDLIKSGSNVFKVDDKYYVDMKQLNKNLLNIKYLKNQNQLRTFAPILVSDELKKLVIQFLKTKTVDQSLASKVSKNEMKIFKRFAKNLNIELNDSNDDDDDDDNKKFKILLGQWISGNDSEIIRKELKKYILRALQEGQIGRNVAYQYLIELS